MKSVLIVEDEKMIRQGVHAMVARSDIDVETILESRNGEEALDVLKEQPIDVVITDIRMPKMDGITLVKKIRELEHQPKIVVLSGYDDFNYAVEVLKNGAKDYILKPIERQKINQVLCQMEEELQRESADRLLKEQMNQQQMKQLLLNAGQTDPELRRIRDQMRIPLLEKGYRAICVRPLEELPKVPEHFLQLKGIEEQHIFLVESAYVLKFLTDMIGQEYCGISSEYTGIETLHLAYKEARKSRIEAFIRCKHPIYYEKYHGNERVTDQHANQQLVDAGFAERFVQQFGTEQMTQSMSQLLHIYFEGQMGQLDAESVVELGRDIWKGLYETYTKVIDMNIFEYARLRQPLNFRNAKEYTREYVEWLTQLKQLMETEFDDYRNKEKIHQAVAYIHANYQKNLNMAVVSNYVSMNYSLFSVTFKEYTGQNFVNYLKMIRLKRAKELLTQTDEKIIDISRMIGYDNEKHFMKLFKSIYGVSPTEYRKNLQIH